VPALRGAALVVLLCGCRHEVTQADCEAMFERHAELVVVESDPDASPAVLAAERQRERDSAHKEGFVKRCVAEVKRPSWECAMTATTSESLERCLE
jgi:hypothetical protein